MKTLTEGNSTKKEILEAYNQVLNLLKQKDASISDPAKEVFVKKSGETLEKANTTVGISIEDQIAGLKKSVTSILGNLSTDIAEEIQTFNTIKDAIKLKEDELKELFDIEKEAFTLTALVNANNEISDQFKVTFSEQKLKAQLELEELRKSLKEARDAHYLEIENYDDEIEKGHARAQEQYIYDFNRTKQIENDAWTDDKNAREKVLADKELVVKTKSAELVVREEKLNELEVKVAEIPVLIAAAVKDGEVAGEAKAKVGFGFEKRAIESKAASEVSILENKIEMLDERNDRQQSEIDILKADLKEAYAKIQEISKASVEAGANVRTISSLESMVKDRTQK
jgi:hypothetical protein